MYTKGKHVRAHTRSLEFALAIYRFFEFTSRGARRKERIESERAILYGFNERVYVYVYAMSRSYMLARPFRVLYARILAPFFFLSLFLSSPSVLL